MNRGKYYLSPEDLMTLMGTYSKRSAYKVHQNIRESIKPGKMNLTIMEYCKYSGDDFEEVFLMLRGEKPKWPPP